MKSINIIFLTLLIIQLLYPTCLLAQQLELNASSKVQIDYQPFSGLPASSTINIFVKPTTRSSNDDDLSTNNLNQNRFRLRIQPSQGSFTARNEYGDSIPIELLSNQSDSKIQRIGNQYTEDINLNFNNTKRAGLNYTVGLSQSHFLKPGVYRLLLDVDILTVTTNEVVSNDQIIEVEVLVAPKLQTNIAGSHSSHKRKFAIIDFGELETNESGMVFLQVRGNIDAEIILSSENSGHLINTSHPNSPIDYSVSFDGTESTLENPLQLIRPVAPTLRGSSYPLKVLIGEVEGAYSGQYIDIITIDVNPQ